MKQYYIKISTAILTTAAKSGLLVNPEADPDSKTSDLPTVDSDPIYATFDRMWVPAMILEQALPMLVQQYEIRKGKGKGKGKGLAIAEVSPYFRSDCPHIDYDSSLAAVQAQI